MEETGSNYTRAMCSFFGELDPVPVYFLQLVGKRYPLKAVRTLKKKEVEEGENYSLQTEATWEHKALSGTDSILCARCKSILWEKPPKRGRINQRGDSSKRIDPGKVRFVFDRLPDAFRSGRAHQWLSGDLTGENFSAHNQ